MNKLMPGTKKTRNASMVGVMSQAHDRQRIIPVLFFLLATTASYCIARFAFQFVLTSDENSYLFQANVFLDGLVARPFTPLYRAFTSHMVILDQHLGWLSRYPFGHPLFLVPGVFVGSPHLIVALAAGFTVLTVRQAGSLLGGHAQGNIAASLLLFSPYFLFYHGTLFSHTSGLLASSLMILTYIAWRQSGNNLYALLSGLSWCFLFNTRTYTALLIAIPFAIDSLYYLYINRSRNTIIGTIIFALSSFFGVIALFAYNYCTTGDAFTMTYLFYNPNDTLGFGQRYYGRVVHTFAKGIENLQENLQLMNVWLWGFWGSLALCFALLAIGWKETWSRLFIAVVFCILAGHIFFYYPGPREAGPGYYLEALPFLVLGASYGLHGIFNHLKRWQFACVATIMAVLSATFMIQNGQVLRAETNGTRKVLDLIAQAPVGSLVFVTLGHEQTLVRPEHDIIFNPQGLHGDILVARSLAEEDKVLVRHFPDRKPFSLVVEETPVLIPVQRDVRYDLLVPAHQLHRGTGTNVELPSGEVLRTARESSHSEGMLASGRRFYVAPGNYRIEYHLKVDACERPGDIALLDVAMHGGRRILASKTVSSGLNMDMATLDVDIDEFLEIEPRVYYLGCGNISLRHIRIAENQSP